MGDGLGVVGSGGFGLDLMVSVAVGVQNGNSVKNMIQPWIILVGKVMFTKIPDSLNPKKIGSNMIKPKGQRFDTSARRKIQKVFLSNFRSDRVKLFLNIQTTQA